MLGWSHFCIAMDLVGEVEPGYIASQLAIDAILRHFSMFSLYASSKVMFK